MVSVLVIVIVLSSLRFSNACEDRLGRGCAVKEYQMEEKKGARGLEFCFVDGVFFPGGSEVGGSRHMEGGWCLIFGKIGKISGDRSESGMLVSSVVG